MNNKQRIINRLNKGFGLDIPYDAPSITHLSALSDWSWSISVGVEDIGCEFPMHKALSWERWVLDAASGEIFEYEEQYADIYRQNKNFFIEEI